MAGEAREKEIWVVATAKGYYGDRVRNEGDKFPISDKKQLGSWMKECAKPKGAEVTEE